MNEPRPPAQEGAGPSRWQRGLPWVVAVGVLAYLAATIPLGEVLAAVGRTSTLGLLGLAVGFVVTLLMADALAMWVGFREALGPARLPYRAALLVRGASYLLAALSYGAGQGGIIYFLRDRYRVGVAEGAGAVLLTTGAFVLVVALAVGAGMAGGAVPDRLELRLTALAVAAALPAYLLVIAWHPGFLARRSVLAPLFDAGVAGTLRVALARAPHLGVLILGHWLALRLFGIQVPLTAALTRLPVLFLVGALPIAPSGLGTTQAAAVTLFAGYAPGADEAARQAGVLAYSLSFHVLGTAVVAGIGVLCLRLVTRDSHTSAHETDDSGSGAVHFSSRTSAD